MTTRAPRGFGLLEATIALAVLAIALVGLTQLQLVSVRSTQFARKASLATNLATDLVDQMSLWPYDDPRLAPAATVSSVTASEVTARLDLGRAVEIPSDSKPHFGEPDDGLSDQGNALALGPWTGLSADADGDGQLDVSRYWSVFGVDANGDAMVDGKVIAVVVRWNEPGLGMRQVSMTTFRANPQVLAP